MFCKKCGSEVVEGATFCTKCGTKIENVVKQQTAKVNPYALSPEQIAKVRKTHVIPIWAWIVIGIVIIGLIGSNIDKADSSQSASSSKPTVAATTPAPTAKPTPTPEVVPTDLKAFAEYIVKKVLPAKTNTEKSTLKEVSIEGDELYIDLYGNDNLTTNMIKTGMLSDFKKVLEPLSKHKDLKNVTVCEYMTFVDAYGKESDAPAMTISISKQKLDNIVWNNFTDDNFAKIADIFYVHPAFNK